MNIPDETIETMLRHMRGFGIATERARIRHALMERAKSCLPDDPLRLELLKIIRDVVGYGSDIS